MYVYAWQLSCWTAVYQLTKHSCKTIKCFICLLTLINLLKVMVKYNLILKNFFNFIVKFKW